MRIFVTGAGGFVGSSLVAYLAAQPDVTEVIAADLATPNSTQFGSGPTGKIQPIQLDVTDAAAVGNVFAASGATHVIHAAAITASGADELAHAQNTVAVNVAGAANVCHAAAATATVTRLLLISSSGVYGAPQSELTRPQQEDDELSLGNLYAITKYSAELVWARIATLADKPFAAVRLPGIYGPLEQARPSRPQVSVMLHLRAALSTGTPVTVAGGDVARDWTYADDMAAGIYALLRTPQWDYSVYNVSCGVLTSFAAVVAAFVAHGLRATWVDHAAGADLAMVPHQARRPLAIDRLRAQTGFVPQFDVTAGVAAWLAAEQVL